MSTPPTIRPEAADALRTLLGELGRVSVLLAQTPGTDVATVSREAHQAFLSLQSVTQFLEREGNP